MILRLTIFILMFGLIAITPVMAMNSDDHDVTEETMQAEESAEAVTPEAVNAGNKICPVSGGEIGSMGEGYPVEYKGKIYNLCCMMCISDFNKDPEKYVKRVNEELAAENQK